MLIHKYKFSFLRNLVNFYSNANRCEYTMLPVWFYIYRSKKDCINHQNCGSFVGQNLIQTYFNFDQSEATTNKIKFNTLFMRNVKIIFPSLFNHTRIYNNEYKSSIRRGKFNEIYKT